MKNLKYKLFFTIICSSLLTSCMDDYFDFDKFSTHTQLSSKWTIPLAYSNLDVHNLREHVNQVIVSDEAGLIVFTYVDTILSETAADLFVLPDQSFQAQIDFDPLPNINKNSSNEPIIITKNININLFEEQKYSVDSIVFNDADLVLTIKSSVNIRGDFQISIPELKKNGHSFTANIEIGPNGTSTLSDHLQNYILNLAEINSETNDLLLELTFTLYPDGKETLKKANGFDFNVSLKNMKYEWFFGTMDVIPTTIGPSSFSIEILRNVFDGTFYIEDPYLRFIILNSFGVPARYGFEYMIARNTNTGAENIVTGLPDFNNSAHTVNMGKHNYPSAIITTSNDFLELGATNSNLPIVIGNLPNQFDYKVNAVINPNDLLTSNNFIHKNSRLDVIGEIEIPLWGRSPIMRLADTINFNIGQSLPDIDQITAMHLNLMTWNGFPCDFRLHGILLDKYDNPVDTLFGTTQEHLIIKSGTIVEDRINQQTGRGYKDTTITLTNERIKRWQDITQIAFTATFNTTGNQSVKFFIDYGLEIRLTADIDVLVDEHL